MTRDSSVKAARRPWLAGLLSLLQPGVGHAYAGNIRRGLALLVILTLSGLAATWIVLVAPPTPWILAAFIFPIALYPAIAVDAMSIAKRAPRPYQLKSYNRWWVYLLMFAALAVLGTGVTQLTRRSLVAYRIPSSSMASAVVIGDWLYVDKRPSARERIGNGAIIVHLIPNDTVPIIKRVVGMAGDTLAMRNDTLIRNGKIIDERYVNLTDPGPTDTVANARIRTWGPFTVPQGNVFVLGDNRHASLDSRYVGPIPLTRIVGIPRLIYYSYNPESGRAVPALTAVRWDRIGRVPR